MLFIFKYIMPLFITLLVLGSSKAQAGKALVGASPAIPTVSLDFDANAFTLKSLKVAGHVVTFRAYEGLIYVARPIDTKFQQMNLYVPVEYSEGKSLGGFSAETAPIFLPNTVGGYMPGEPGSPGPDRDGKPNAALLALSKGYVVAAPGVRGRTLQDASGQFTGKAPACIVDLKATVRYLRHNDSRTPGDANKIISNGTSAGGALSALLGATGNSKVYEPYLRELGAADEQDNILAASCYCPITNLDHADSAYEWLFRDVKNFRKMDISRMPNGQIQRREIQGTVTAEQLLIAKNLKALFPAYLNSLNLKCSDGKPLILDDMGNGLFKEYVKSSILTAANVALTTGQDLSGAQWLNIVEGKVVDLDFDQYLQAIQRMKTPPAFDALDLQSGENDLFGTATTKAQHFTDFATTHSTVNGTKADPHLVATMNPMEFIGKPDATIAKFWRVRHGTNDRDTSGHTDHSSYGSGQLRL